MGLESYLLIIKLKQPLTEKVAIPLFQQVGLVYLSEKSLPFISAGYRDHYFELRTDKGLTEVHLSIAPEDTESEQFCLRFSVMSPTSVVDQSFDLLQKLNMLVEIEVFDKEIRNHILRQLRQTKKVDQNFLGLSQQDDEAIDKLCIIALDPEDFRRNEFEIQKRQIVLNNEKGEIVEGGSATINLIEKKGLFEKFFGWIKKEL